MRLVPTAALLPASLKCSSAQPAANIFHQGSHALSFHQSSSIASFSPNHRRQSTAVILIRDLYASRLRPTPPNSHAEKRSNHPRSHSQGFHPDSLTANNYFYESPSPYEQIDNQVTGDKPEPSSLSHRLGLACHWLCARVRHPRICRRAAQAVCDLISQTHHLARLPRRDSRAPSLTSHQQQSRVNWEDQVASQPSLEHCCPKLRDVATNEAQEILVKAPAIVEPSAGKVGGLRGETTNTRNLSASPIGNKNCENLSGTDSKEKNTRIALEAPRAEDPPGMFSRAYASALPAHQRQSAQPLPYPQTTTPPITVNVLAADK